MVLAAGLGTRLQPLTRHLPKPLLPVLGRPLLGLVFDRLGAAGVAAIAVNVHHLREPVIRFVEEYTRGGARDAERDEVPIVATGAPLAEASTTAVETVVRPAVTLFPEREILGTGGALGNARAFLSQSELFLLHNGDVFCDFDLRRLVAEHRRHGGLGTLLLLDEPRVNTVRADSCGRIVALGGARPEDDRFHPGEGGERALTYTGIAVLHRRFLDLLPEGPSSLVDALRKAVVREPGSIRSFAPGGFYWNDLGTVRRFLDMHEDLLVRQRTSLSVPGTVVSRQGADAGKAAGGRNLAGARPEADGLEAAAAPDESVMHMAPGAVCEEGVVWSGFLSLGRGARVEAGNALRDCVVMGGVKVGAGAKANRPARRPGNAFFRAVIGKDWIVTQEDNERHRLRETVTALLHKTAAVPATLPHGRAERITGHGSDRRFWRLRVDDLRAVLLQVPPDDPDFERFVAVGRFLWKEGFGGPRILDADAARRTILMEDLGEESLYRRVLSGPEAGDGALRRSLYLRIVERLVDLQVRGTRLVEAGSCPEAGARRFDIATLRWETDYFRRRFLEEFAGIPASESAALDEEFDRLARLVVRQPVALLHRDFQSQNIILQGETVRLVDFQGMRRGPLLYDLMSLVRDAYVDLGDQLRGELLERYRDALARGGGPKLSRPQVARMAVLAGLQRNMQALGAFAFLSGVKGKREFLAHVPLALRHLAEGLHEAAALTEPVKFPRLQAMVTTVAGRLKRMSEDPTPRRPFS